MIDSTSPRINGRKKSEPINHGANPNGGFRKDGAVSSMCNSIGAIQPGYGNCAPVQLEFDPGIVNDQEGVDKMAAMIKNKTFLILSVVSRMI